MQKRKCARRCGLSESQNWSETLLYQCRGEGAGRTRSQSEELHDVGPDNGSSLTRQCSVLCYPRQAHPTERSCQIIKENDSSLIRNLFAEMDASASRKEVES